MTYEIVFVLLVAGTALVLFAMDRIRLDQLSMSVPVVLMAGALERFIARGLLVGAVKG